MSEDCVKEEQRTSNNKREIIYIQRVINDWKVDTVQC